MIAYIDRDGALVLEAENETELFALSQWDNEVDPNFRVELNRLAGEPDPDDEK